MGDGRRVREAGNWENGGCHVNSLFYASQWKFTSRVPQLLNPQYALIFFLKHIHEILRMAIHYPAR
jgi:hypothetical protein